MQALTAFDSLVMFGPFLLSALVLGIVIHIHGLGGR